MGSWWGCSCSDTFFLAGGGRQSWAAWLAWTKGRNAKRSGWAVCDPLGLVGCWGGPLFSSTWGCQEDALYCILPFPTPCCREMLVCLVWMAALGWRASLDHR